MKKMLAALLAALMLLSSSALAEAPLMGGWTPAASPEITEEVRAVFDKALEGLVGVSYVPVAYLGRQIVAGTNHCILCQATPVYPNARPSYVLMYLHESLNGEAGILHIADLDIGAFCEYPGIDE